MGFDLKKVVKELKKRFGDENVFSDRPTSIVYAKDVMPYDVEDHNIPYAVVRPGDAGDVSALLRYANEVEIPVHIHGSGTSLVGLTRPKTKCLILDTARMNSINVFPERGYFEAGPGIHLAKARKTLAPFNAMLPVFPGSELVATLGGAVAVNTSAHAVDSALGKPGDFVLGLEAVMPTGEILNTGTESVRRPAGIEATKFLVGSEGLLCVLTSIRMRLVPMPFFENIVAYYSCTEDILDTVMEMYRRGISPPLFYEYLDEKAAKIGFEAVGLKEPTGAVAMMSVHAATEKGCEDKANHFLDFLKAGNPLEAKLVKDKGEWEKIWGSRAEAGNYIYRLGTTFGSEITPRVDLLKEAFKEAKEIIGGVNSLKDPQFFSFGHIGAPTIHAYAFYPTKEIDNETKKELVKEVREKTEDLNRRLGGCGGEWGVTAQRASFLKKKYGSDYYNFLKALKRSVDPKNILNRGNLEGWV